MTGWFEANLVSLLELVEVRSAIEPAIASAAARHCSDDDLEHLRLHLSTMGTAVADNGASLCSAADSHFHQRIATVSRNNLFPLMTAAVGEMTRSYREAAARLGPAILKRSHEDHVAKFSNLERGDPDTAHQAMFHHIVETVIDFDIVSHEELK